jgi:hypothetical protein
MQFKSQFQQAIKSRAIIGLWALLLVQTLVLVTVVAIWTRSSSMQVPVRFSEFSSIRFATGQWYYPITFALFGLIVFGLAVVISLKLLEVKGRPFALGFLYLMAAVLLISTALILTLLRVTGLLY